MIRRARHLPDERLFDCYLAERSGEPLDPPTAEHLADCSSCAARYAELGDFVDGLRAEGETEADAVFTPERLRAQRQLVARRIEHVGHPARIISFPRQIARGTMTASGSRTAPRWVAAAAAAGLFVGLALGASYQWDAHGRPDRAVEEIAATRPARLTPVATRGGSQSDVGADAVFLSDLEAALERPRTRELLAFDAFTPHVREIRDPMKRNEEFRIRN